MISRDMIAPRPGWALCRTIRPVEQSTGGLLLVKDMETGKTTEGCARVLRVEPAQTEDGAELPPGFVAGDLIIFRDYLKFAHPLGDLIGADRNDRVFLINNRDVLAVVRGSGTLGFYEEYEISEPP